MSLNTMSRLLLAALLLSQCAALAMAQESAEEAVTLRDDQAAQREFTLKVLPLLKDRCLGCHGGDQADIKGDFSVLTLEDLLRGGESEQPAVVPGKPGEGTLIDAISWSGLEMPPKENDRLSEDQVVLFRRWIERGAPWPDEQAQQRYIEEEAQRPVTDEGMIVATSGGTSAQWTGRRYLPDDVWALVKVKPKSELLPSDVSADQAIDYFVDSRLQAEALVPAGRASPRNLIRRATFDLTGLPPTPQEIDAFEAACRKDAKQAWSDLIDRLLESPRYGEQWARHWLE